MHELMGVKIHQIWLKETTDHRLSEHVYRPWGYYTFLDENYDVALRTCSLFTSKGYDVKLVTLVATYVL